MNANETQPTSATSATGALKIGRGAALHPARKDQYGVTATCSCPNTQNGFGNNIGQFFAGVSPTCKRSAVIAQADFGGYSRRCVVARRAFSETR